MILVTYAMPEEKPQLNWSRNVVPVCTGIGKVLAVSQVAKHLASPIDLLISVGFCGGLNGTRQGQLVMPTTTRQWDLFLSDLDLPLGHGYAMHCPLGLPKLPLSSVPSPVQGELISGDRFVDSTVHVDKQAVAVDMETAALALLACELSIPFVSLREVSDVADGPQQQTHQQFMERIRQKGPDYTAGVQELLELNPADISPPVKLA
jgi:adenosylhomocysteine nucleosidase